ncbi:MAG TPA: Fe-S cluster assembly protein SufD, partial [Paraburkholderia sp.]|nr:Fe-S cluster assembly protein SufD [Paraburkholderia sp.]
DLRAMLREVKPLAAPPGADAKKRAAGAGEAFAGLDCRRLVFVNGTFVPDLSDLNSLEPGLTVRSMAQGLATADPLVVAHLGKAVAVSDAAIDMNTALVGDGALIHVAADAVIERPLHLVFATVGERPAAIFMRTLVVIENSARVQLIESHEGRDDVDYQINTALDIVIGDDACVDRVKFTNEGSRALHVASLLASVGARATFNDFSFTTGGSVVRNQLFLRLAGEATTANTCGVNLLTGRQHADTTLIADHAVGGCQTRQLFKSVLDGDAHGVFQGKIVVRPDAQKTDAKMMSRALLLSESAEAVHKPELEIFADDVQCGHGATTGALGDDLKFYLMARGIPARDAESLLIQAFVGEAVAMIAHEGLRNVLSDAAVAWLQARG